MIKRTVVISSPSRVTLKANQLVCSNLEDSSEIKTAPIEDLGLVLVENQRTIISVPLINALADNNVSLVYCNAGYMPSSILCSLDSNSSQSEVLRLQVEASEARNKRIWKQLIESKISNQSRLLDKLGKDGSVLKPYCTNVKTGDVDNREGIAAKVYWKRLFGNNFVRLRDGLPPNNLLNYGYSILRSAVVRALMGSGLNPAFGVFHRNRYNAMPLADDVIEPFRPFVDEVVFRLYEDGETDLTKENKGILITCLNCDTSYGNIRRPLQIGLSITTASLVQYYKEETKTLSLPVIDL